MKISARNCFKGKVLNIRKGPVTSQIHVDIGGGNTISAVITTDATEDLCIDVGSDVEVIVKSSDVMLSMP